MYFYVVVLIFLVICASTGVYFLRKHKPVTNNSKEGNDFEILE